MNPPWDLLYKQQPWNAPSGPSVAPTCSVKLNGSPDCGQIIWRLRPLVKKSAVHQERNKHRDAAPVGRVGFQPKLRQQKVFLGTRFHPETKGYEQRAQERHPGCLNGCGRQQRDDEARDR